MIFGTDVQKVYLGNQEVSKILIQNTEVFNSTVTSFPTTGLMAFWKFNDLTDSSGNNHNLTQNNGIASFTTGKVDNCFNYLGNPTNASLDNAPYLTNSTLRFPGSFTFSMWHRFISPFVPNQFNDRGNSIVQFYNTFGIGTVPNDPTRILITDLATWDFQTATGAITIGEWVHYVVTSNATSGEKKLYINGVVAATVTNSNTLSFNSSVRPLGFGGDTTDINDNTPTPALIDATGVWNRVLTDQEISILYNNGNGREP